MLKLHEITKDYGDFTLGPLNLAVKNEVVVVLGPSGSGKTTLLSLIAGITSLDTGKVTLHGNDLSNRPLEHRNTGLVFQDGSLFPHMTARENIEYATANTTTITELADMFEITGVLDQSPTTLSGGEIQRVALARTLAADPEVLLLDEPLSSLDTPTRRRLRDELHTVFNSLQIPVLLVTHNQRTAMALGDRLAILNDGKIEQIGTPEKINTTPETPFVARFTGNTNLLETQVIDRGDGIITLKTGGLTLTAEGDYPVGDTVTACFHPARIKVEPERNQHDPIDNTTMGVVDRWLNEGTQYRVEITIPDLPTSLFVTIPPIEFDDLDLQSTNNISLEFPPHAIHVITNTDSTNQTEFENHPT